MDGGFWYSVPARLAERVGVGSLVRVPLGGRRTRGYVVGTDGTARDGLRDILGVSGEAPLFDARLRDSLVWAAHYYVAPLSVLLERAAPPNLAGPPGPEPASPVAAPGTAHPLDDVVAAIAPGRRRPPVGLLSSWEDGGWIDALAPLAGRGSSLLVVAATGAEVEAIAFRFRRRAGDRVRMVTPGLDDAAITATWSTIAARPGMILVGTPRVACWPVAGLGAAVVVEEGRRAMKDRQTPTVSVRRILMTRGRLEGFAQVYVGPTPSVELVGTGAEILRTGNRAWPLVEVIDRNEEPPGSGLISPRTRNAIARTLERGGRVFVFSHRRGYAPAYRCSSCRELRRCPGCGSRPEPGESCPRCASPSRPCLRCGGESFEPLGAGVGRVLHELRSALGEAVGEAGSGAPVEVGSERDLAGLDPVALAVAVDADGLALGSHYRAGEEALRVLARLAGRVRRGSGHRMIVQTSLPDSPLMTALRRGDPVPYLDHELSERRTMGYPPAGELMVVEIRGEAADADTELRAQVDQGVTVMGPAPMPGGRRWLVQGARLGAVKLALRPVVQRWREAGATVRIDVDPLDL